MVNKIFSCSKCGKGFDSITEVEIHKCDWWKPLFYEKKVTGLEQVTQLIVVVIFLSIYQYTESYLILIPAVISSILVSYINSKVRETIQRL